MLEVLYRCTVQGRAFIKKNNKQIRVNRRTGRSFITSSDKFRSWAAFAGIFIARAHKGDPIQGALNLKLVCTYRSFAHQQDLDNTFGGVLDLLQSTGVIENDKQVLSFDGSRKVYDDTETERFEIELTRHLFINSRQQDLFEKHQADAQKAKAKRARRTS